MSVWPAWELREGAESTAWFDVRLVFADGARVDALAVMSGGRVSVEEVRAQPPLSFGDLAVLPDWIRGPLYEVCGPPAERGQGVGEGPAGAPEYGIGETVCGLGLGLGLGPGPGPGAVPSGARRARPGWPRGSEGRWLVAQEYRAAQREGADPVLAVMCATGRSRRRSLRMISQARDAGYLAPRHARR
ncbi:DUF6214 family protein [Streptomyces sp. NPDC059378]|uniref:DUF6214 family protein n=1 Tax=Streptomyces sp. NPDC059378 TaxID=3346815 RepID=UPI00368E4AF1